MLHEQIRPNVVEVGEKGGHSRGSREHASPSACDGRILPAHLAVGKPQGFGPRYHAAKSRGRAVEAGSLASRADQCRSAAVLRYQACAGPA